MSDREEEGYTRGGRRTSEGGVGGRGRYWTLQELTLSPFSLSKGHKTLDVFKSPKTEGDIAVLGIHTKTMMKESRSKDVRLLKEMKLVVPAN